MRPPLDLSVYLVTDPSARQGVVGTAAAAAGAGARVVQLRDKTLTDADFVALGRALAAALAPLGVPLIVNDRLALVEAIGAAGAHIGQSDIDPAAARRLLGPEPILGLSIEALDQVAAIPAGVDYLGVGPVRATQTKPDHAPPMGWAGFAAVCARAPLPCVAIGGVDGRDAAAVKAAGGAGLAVVSAICAADDPAEAARAIRQAWRDA